jgi:hypothetical protein
VRPAVASSWNEDYPFAKIDTIKPDVSSMLGEMAVIRGRRLDRVSSVCVHGIDVSQEPKFRASIVERTPAGVSLQNEIELTSPDAVRWFKDVIGNATGIPFRPKDTSSGCAAPSGTRRREGPGSSVGGGKIRVLGLYVKTSINSWLAIDTFGVKRTLAAVFELPNPEVILASVRDTAEGSIVVTVTIPAGVLRVSDGYGAYARMRLSLCMSKCVRTGTYGFSGIYMRS